MSETQEAYVAGYVAGYQQAANDAQDLLWSALTRLQGELDSRCIDLHVPRMEEVMARDNAGARGRA